MHQLYDWFGLNVVLFHLINRLHVWWWDRLMLAMTWLGDHSRYPYYAALALLIAYLWPRHLPPRNVVVLAVGYVLSGWVVMAVKPFLDFPRPLLALGPQAVHVVGTPEYAHSFPSGHSTFVVLVAAALAPGTARSARGFLVLYAVLVCTSRMVLGAHFPADVLGGALIALAAVAVVRLALPARPVAPAADAQRTG